MTRHLTVAAGQLGPIGPSDSRGAVVQRLIRMLEEAGDRRCDLVVFPEMALTPFFPRNWIPNPGDRDRFFEFEMPSVETKPLFEAAARLGIGFYLGYCEAVDGPGFRKRFNTAILVDGAGQIVGKYRKVHLPGNAVYDPSLKLQHLEACYFDDGDLGFPVFEAFGGRVGMLICNDRRWPEPYRVMGLQGVELICLGYNSPAQLPDHPEQNALRTFHHLVPMQAAAYQNGTWIVATAKAGLEEGCDMMGQSCIIAPSGEVLAIASTLEDELLSYRIDLDKTLDYKRFFDFGIYRRPEAYGLITKRRAVGPPLAKGDMPSA
ncbi:MAG: N-carbamoyl-D-amino-acid hydrolase [Pseudomonadota bacterium]